MDFEQSSSESQEKFNFDVQSPEEHQNWHKHFCENESFALFDQPICQSILNQSSPIEPYMEVQVKQEEVSVTESQQYFEPSASQEIHIVPLPRKKNKQKNGCNCKNNQCKKNYCPCFRSQEKKCSKHCGCVGCNIGKYKKLPLLCKIQDLVFQLYDYKFKTE